MKLTNVEKKENNQVELSILVEKDEFEEAMQKAYKKNVSNINIQGFRKGKAPRKMIEKLYGPEIFYEDAINFCYPQAYDAAVREADIETIDNPALTDFDIKDGEFSFKAVVSVKPQLNVKKYKGLEAEKPVVEISDEQVDAEVERMAERNARQVPVEREAKDGDEIIFDFEGFVDGKAFEGGKAEHYALRLGSGMFIPGFESQIEGHKADEDFEVNVTFPEDYHAEELKGKPATFKCRIHEVKEIQKPAIDDEFAKDISEFDTMEEYKKDLKEKMTASAQERADSEYKETLLSQLAENLEGEVPAVMYENEIDQIVNNFSYRMAAQGLDFDSYLKATDMQLDALRQLYRPQAERNVKVRLALEAVARLENLEASDEDTEKEIEEAAKQYNMPVEKIKTLITLSGIKSDIMVQKAIDFVVANAKAPKKPRKTASRKKKETSDCEAAAEAENTTEKAEDKE